MAVLRQLRDPQTYRRCDWDFADDPAARAYWHQHFLRHLELLRGYIRDEYRDADPARLAAFERAYRQRYATLLDGPVPRPLDIYTLDLWRGELLAASGFADPWKTLRARGNRAALEQLPVRLARHDALDEAARIEPLVRGLLAGNLFDLGAFAAVERFRESGGTFERILEAVPPRPWFRDDLDRWRQRWLSGGGWRHVALFVDNTGVDLVLGVLPLARWMTARGARVTLLANAAPALNDITVDELRGVLSEAAAIDAPLRRAWQSQRLAVVSTGSATPLIDLTQLEADCVEQIADADLIILEGMGRAIESNRLARFSCDVLRVAMLKDEAVAAHVGGRLFDAYFELTEPGGS